MPGESATSPWFVRVLLARVTRVCAAETSARPERAPQPPISRCRCRCRPGAGGGYRVGGHQLRTREPATCGAVTER